MFTLDDLKKISPLFLTELYRRTQGDPSIQVSMYEIGEALGLDRKASSRTAEDLLGTGLAEIKTLSGGIGITAEGAAQMQPSGTVETGSQGYVLGNAPVLDQTGRKAVEQITAELKSRVGEHGLNFDALAELMADLKTIDAQLSSPNPKTDIIRACFQSISGMLRDTSIQTLLGK